MDKRGIDILERDLSSLGECTVENEMKINSGKLNQQVSQNLGLRNE